MRAKYPRGARAFTAAVPYMHIVYVSCTDAQIVETESVLHLFGTGPNHGKYTCRARLCIY